MKSMNIIVKRKEGEKSYAVPFTPGMRVLDVLLYIQEHIEPDLAFRWNCGEGICGSCAAEVNGKAVLMCKEEIKPYLTTIIIYPLRVFPIIKDLVTNPAEVYKKLDRLKPYFTGKHKKQKHNKKSHKEFYAIYDEQIQECQEMRRCIDCYICYDSCHVINNHTNLRFTGPINIVKAAALDKHPQEEFERALLLEKEGLWNCNVTRCCTQNCPQNIKITEDAIIWEKERAVSLRRAKKSK